MGVGKGGKRGMKERLAKRSKKMRPTTARKWGNKRTRTRRQALRDASKRNPNKDPKGKSIRQTLISRAKENL